MINSFIVWNVRGIGNRSTVRYLNQLVRDQGIKLLAISEPHIKFHFAQGIARKIGLQVVFGNSGEDSKIWIFHDQSLSFQIVQLHQQFLTVGLIEGREVSMFFTFVYASCNHNIRREMFDDLMSFSNGVSLPWILSGDFNCVASPEEKLGGRSPSVSSMIDFQSFQAVAGLCDAGFSGSVYTWTNNQLGSSHIRARLDRVFYNSQWLGKGIGLSVKHLIRGPSDHSPLLVSMAQNISKPGRFIYQAMWQLHSDFLAFVKGKWEEIGCISANPLFMLQYKLKILKAHLKVWNKEVFGDVHKDKEDAIAALEAAQQSFDEVPSVENKEALNLANATFKQILAREEVYWFQKSRVQWLQVGDRNTSFFHNYTKIRQQRNFIQRLKIDGEWVEDQDVLANGAVVHFQKLLSSESHSIDEDLLEVIPPLISEEQNSHLCSLPTAEEIKQAVFSLSGNSAPGPDGFTGNFYTYCWDIVGEDIIKAAQGFFQGWNLPQGMTSTLICLIPKIKSPSCFADYRPISLCNFSFKVVSKILSNRLQPILPNIISREQSGFISGRLISDNFLLARELYLELDRSVRGHNMLIKLDMAKAYDRLEWDSLLAALQRFGFSSRFTSLISQTLMNCWFSISFNGQSKGYFKSTRGVRQGDPLAPSLFVIAEEILSRGLSSLFQSGKCFPFHVPRGVPSQSHLLYADDSIIFLNGSKRSVTNLLEFLGRYEQSTGQSINNSKCCFMVSKKMPISAINRLKIQTGYQYKDFSLLYLGIPLFKGRLKVVHFKYLIDRFQSRLAGWQCRALSQAGRVVLIRSVLSSIPIYTASAISIPLSIQRQLDKICSNFFWQGSEPAHRKHWLAWNKICCPVECGGLGIRSLRDIQLSFQVKLIWLALFGGSLWAKFVQSKYLKGQHLTDCTLPFPAGIRKQDFQLAKSILLSGLRMAVKDGSRTSFFKDTWYRFPLAEHFSVPQPIENCTVREVLLNSHHLAWSVISNSEVLNELRQYTLSDGQDTPVWKFTSSGSLTVKTVYKAVISHSVLSTMGVASKKFLHSKIPPRAGLFSWRLLQQAVPVDSRIQSIGVNMVSCCSCCQVNKDTEDFTHLFLKGELAAYLWNMFKPLISGYSFRTGTLFEWLSWCATEVNLSIPDDFIPFLIIISTLWEIWKSRCQSRFEGITPNATRVFHSTLQSIRDSLLQIKFDQFSCSIYRLVVQNFGISVLLRKFQCVIVRWLPSPFGNVLNVDGSCKYDSGLAGGGGCVRNSRGEILLGFSFFYGYGSIIQAEGRAILDALRLVNFLQIPISEIQSDSLILVDSIANNKTPPWVLFPWWEELISRLHSCGCSISHVYREINQVADSLADHAIHLGCNRIFSSLQEFPPRAKAYAIADSTAVPNFRRRCV